jgi:hypothetical protein
MLLELAVMKMLQNKGLPHPTTSWSLQTLDLFGDHRLPHRQSPCRPPLMNLTLNGGMNSSRHQWLPGWTIDQGVM